MRRKKYGSNGRDSSRRFLQTSSVTKTPECFYSTEYGYKTPDECYNEMIGLTDLPPPCITNASQLAFIDGVFSADATFYTCLENIPDAGSIASFYNGQYNGCWVYTFILTLLNLVQVDEVQGVSVLQITVDLVWYDLRYNMPLFWENVDQGYSGIDLTTLITNDSVVIWKPEFTFPDASQVNILSESLSMYYAKNRSTFFYEATYALTLVQPGFDFRKYPNDEQNIVIRASILNYDAEQLQLFPGGIYCSYVNGGHTCSFSQNPLWTWNSGADTCTTYADKKDFSPIWPSYVVYSINISRESEGLIVRFILPITLLLLLSAVTFWLSYENRIDTTITLLLSVSALYIVILQNIPMVGYLTNVDKFVFVMFIVLVLVVIAHQVYGTLQEKIEKWPLKKVYMRIIEMMGRVILIPIILGYFFYNVTLSNPAIETSLLTIACVSSVAFFYQECLRIKREWKRSIRDLIDKVNQPTLTLRDISWFERLILNYLIFNMISMDSIYLSKLLHEKGEIKLTEKKNFMELRKQFQLNTLLRGEGGGGGGGKRTSSDDAEVGGSNKAGNHVQMTAVHRLKRGDTDNPMHEGNQEFAQKMIGAEGRMSEISVDSDDEHDA